MLQLTIPTLTPYSKVQPGSGTLRHAVAALQPTTTSAKHAHAIRACRERALLYLDVQREHHAAIRCAHNYCRLLQLWQLATQWDMALYGAAGDAS